VERPGSHRGSAAGRAGLARLALLVVALLAAAPARALVPVPSLTGPVVDLAGLLDRSEKARLEELSRAARAQNGGHGPQVQFLLVPSLQGEPIEELSMRAAEAWKLGSRGPGNGILVTVSRDDHAVRIEVGGGLEGELTDAKASRIIRETIAPAFRANRFADGLIGATIQILGAVSALPPDVAAPPHAEPAVHVSSLGVVVFLVVLLLLRIAGGFGGGRSRSLWLLPFILGSSRGRGG
jgi:uncharacterized protein